MKEKLQQIARSNNWAFDYGRDDFSNLERVEDKEFYKCFSFHSAAKSVHHGYVGGLLEHTLSVAKLCDFYARHYGDINRDILLSAALCHDIGKTKEK